MGNKEFAELAIDSVLALYNERLLPKRKIEKDDVHIVWMCKTLQNNKALLSTTVDGDGMYYECTYNGNKRELYVDEYTKLRNRCFKLGGME